MGRRRWIRLDIDYWKSEWLFELSGHVRRLWPDLLCIVKASGVGGVCKMPSMKVLAKLLDAKPSEIAELVGAAVAHGALLIDGDTWTVMKWPDYQDYDPTAAERMRRMRAKQETVNNLRVVNGDG